MLRFPVPVSNPGRFEPSLLKLDVVLELRGAKHVDVDLLFAGVAEDGTDPRKQQS